MPTIASFYGISIRMFFSQGEHNPPHFHAQYGGEAAAYGIKDLKRLDGFLPVRAERMVLEWAESHQAELLDIWRTQQFVKLPPLD